MNKQDCKRAVRAMLKELGVEVWTDASFENLGWHAVVRCENVCVNYSVAFQIKPKRVAAPSYRVTIHSESGVGAHGSGVLWVGSGRTTSGAILAAFVEAAKHVLKEAKLLCFVAPPIDHPALNSAMRIALKHDDRRPSTLALPTIPTLALPVFGDPRGADVAQKKREHKPRDWKGGVKAHTPSRGTLPGSGTGHRTG